MNVNRLEINSLKIVSSYFILESVHIDSSHTSVQDLCYSCMYVYNLTRQTVPKYHLVRGLH